jgi:hypothetical protein
MGILLSKQDLPCGSKHKKYIFHIHIIFKDKKKKRNSFNVSNHILIQKEYTMEKIMKDYRVKEEELL